MSQSEQWRDLFELDPERIFMDNLLLVSHPKPVREAIEAHRQQFDRAPGEYWWDQVERVDAEVYEACGRYLGVSPREIVLTDSATMGLGLFYSGFDFKKGDEVVLSDQEHYSCVHAVDTACQRFGVSKKTIKLYRDPWNVTEESLVQNLMSQISPATRIVAMTWVHSSTGVKLPIASMGRAIKALNQERPEDRRMFFVVDGVHGFGIEHKTMPQLECDGFITSCHKWLFGPRGTGLMWLTPALGEHMYSVIPTYDIQYFDQFVRQKTRGDTAFGRRLTPGGFHSFEHRWALPSAIQLHEDIGRPVIEQEIHRLAAYLKAGLRKISGIQVMTPKDQSLSSGLVCFERAGWTPGEVVSHLKSKGILATVTPYFKEYARLSPGIYNSLAECDRVLDAISTMDS